MSAVSVTTAAKWTYMIKIWWGCEGQQGPSVTGDGASISYLGDASNGAWQAASESSWTVGGGEGGGGGPQQRTCGELIDEGERLFLGHGGGFGARVPGRVTRREGRSVGRSLDRRGRKVEIWRCNGVSCSRAGP